MQGSLADTLKHVNPTIFFAVPRVYEKFEEKIRSGLNSANFIKKKIGIINFNYYFFIFVKFSLKYIF